MGVYSTEMVTRQEALSRIYSALEDASDEEISEVLFALFANKVLNNYMIVPGEENGVSLAQNCADLDQQDGCT